MTPKERAAMQQALDTILNSIPHYPDEADEAITALREALEVTEASISDHKFEQVMVSVDFLRQVEQLLIEFMMDEEYEWGYCRPLEVMEEKKLLPKEVYQIRKILEEAPVFGFTQAHTSDKPLHHYALVLRDLDKTVEGWCEKPEFYLNGERVYAEQAEPEPVAWVGKGGFNECGEGQPLYAAPVRTKDLTDDEIWEIWFKDITLDWDERCRAVIAADREKNK